MEYKYILHPGPVISKTDGDRHYIGAKKLAELYNVSPGECLVFDEDKMNGCVESMIHLYPDYYGEYKLPEKGL